MEKLTKVKNHLNCAIAELVEVVVILDSEVFNNTIKEIKETIGDLHVSMHLIEGVLETKKKSE